MILGELYLRKNLYDSSLSYLTLAQKTSEQTDTYNSRPYIYTLIAENKIRQKKYNEALDNFKKTASASIRSGNNTNLPKIISGLGEAELKLGNLNEAIRDFHQVLALSEMYRDQSYQEMSRVMLNVYNNAFYTMEQKVKLIDKGYVPTIHVKTQRANNKVLITVKDNGIGISENLTGKIFQPFFKTKPTGDGTGLGLSISYDIIKGRGGDIDLKTEEGKFTEFIISLPY